MEHTHLHNDELFLNTHNVPLLNHLNTDDLPLYITGKDAYSKDAYSLYFYPTPFNIPYSCPTKCKPVSCKQSCYTPTICYNQHNVKRSIYFPQYIKSVKHKIRPSTKNVLNHSIFPKDDPSKFNYNTNKTYSRLPVSNVGTFNYKTKSQNVNTYMNPNQNVNTYMNPKQNVNTYITKSQIRTRSSNNGNVFNYKTPKQNVIYYSSLKK